MFSTSATRFAPDRTVWLALRIRWEVSKLRMLGWALMALGLLTLPSLTSAARNDAVAAGALERLPVPDGAEQLDTISEVTVIDGACQVVSGRLLATELTPSALARRTHASPHGTWFAWSEPGAFVAASWDGEELRRGSRGPKRADLPSSVEKALARWMILPNGVRRVIVYQLAPAHTFAELRCHASA